MLRAALTSVALAAATLVVTGGPATAVAESSLPVKAASDLLVDAAHRRVLISDGKTGMIMAQDYVTGARIFRNNLPGVGELALSGDGKKVYAAVADAHAIVAFDAATMTETSRYALSDVAYPRTLALAGGTLYFGWDKDPAVTPRGVFGSVDLATGAIRPNIFPSPVGIPHGAPRLLTAPGAPDKLVVADTSGDATTAGNTWVYDVSGATPVLTAEATAAPGPVTAVALSRDGSKIIGVDGTCGAFTADTANPAQRTPLYSGLCARPALAVHPSDGRVAVGHGSQDLTVFPAGSQVASQSLGLNLATPQRLAWEPGGKRLFAIGLFLGEYSLHVLNEPITTAISLGTTTAPVPQGAGVTISGKFTMSGPPPIPLRLFDVTRTDAESPSGRPLPQIIAQPYDPYFSFVDYPEAAGKVTYTVTYRGEGRMEPATAKVSVNVKFITPVLTLTGGKVAAYGSTATVTARLGKTYRNRTVAIWADPAGAEPAKLLRNTKVDANGNLTASVKLTRNTGVVAKFAGDTRYAPVSSPVQMLYTRVAVALTNAKQYKTATLGGVPTSYYRKTVHPVFSTTMTPYPKRKERLQFEVLWKGKWTASRTVDVPLNSAGKASYTLTGAHSTGLRYRVRAVYLAGASGDTVNATTYGAYRYFTFTN
ncbi:YncE family protein [Actinoplanes sp. NPDC000266]